ncbi:MAG: pro-sigmaK processing inhibitor BofA family protein [Clostridia bacterium]|nr:pro-sigmaK processing inhibitor BofA family protein [Clostridia bacterium]
MTAFQPKILITLALCVLALYMLSQLFDPQRPHGRMLTRCVTGLMLLLAWNLIIPLRLGANPLSAWIAGSLGLPGLGLLAALAMMV